MIMYYVHTTCMCYAMIIVDACMCIIVHACTTNTVHACTMIIVRACNMIIVHACTMITEHVSCPKGLMFGVLEGGGSGGRRPPNDGLHRIT